MRAQHAAAASPYRILVGLDGSPHAEAILGPVREIATRLGAEVTLLHKAPSGAEERAASAAAPSAYAARAVRAPD